MRLRVVREGRWVVAAVSSERGDCDLLDFLDSLQPNLRGNGDRIMALFKRIADADVGPRLLPDEISHQIAGPIWEFIQGRLRVLWFYGEKRKLVICTHGFVKAQNRTPAAEIRLAQQQLDAYQVALRQGRVVIEHD